MNQFGSYLDAGLALGITLGAVMALVLLFLRRVASHGLDGGQQRLLASKYGLFNSLYTFFLTLAVVTLLSGYNQSKTAVHQEAERLLFLHRASAELYGSGQFRQALELYTQSIVKDEWPILAEKRPSDATESLSRLLWEGMRAMAPKDFKEAAIYQELVRELAEAQRGRIARTLFARGHLFPLIWVVIGLGFALCFVQFFHTSLPQRGAQAAYDFVVLSMLAMVIMVLYSLDHPFQGLARIPPTSFEHVLEVMRRVP